MQLRVYAFLTQNRNAHIVTIMYLPKDSYYLIKYVEQKMRKINYAGCATHVYVMNWDPKGRTKYLRWICDKSWMTIVRWRRINYNMDVLTHLALVNVYIEMTLTVWKLKMIYAMLGEQPSLRWKVSFKTMKSIRSMKCSHDLRTKLTTKTTSPSLLKIP